MSLNQDTQFMISWLRENVGINITEKSHSNFTNRVKIIKKKYHLNSDQEIVSKLTDGAQKVFQMDFINQLTTNYTFFFREIEVLKHIEREVLQKELAGKNVRIWCAACSTGQEAYSLSMMSEQAMMALTSVNILATDIDTNAISIAENCLYNDSDYQSIPDEYVRIGLSNIEQEKSILPHIKNRITFRVLNLISTPWPMKKTFDIIFCRNVLYYFSADVKDRLINRFHDILNAGGYLVISVSDSHAIDRSKFEKITSGIFKKI